MLIRGLTQKKWWVAQGDEAHTELHLLYQSIIHLLSSLMNNTPYVIWTSPPAAVYGYLLPAYTSLVSGETKYLGLFSADFHSGLVARSWKPIKCILKTLFRWCKQHQIVHKKQTVDLAASNSDSHVNLFVTVYPIHMDYEEQWWQYTTVSESNTRNLMLPTWTQTFDQEYNNLTASSKHHTQAKLRKAFHQGPGHMLSWVCQNMCRHLWHTPTISHICWRVKIWSVLLYGRDEHHTVYPSGLVQLFCGIFFQDSQYTIFQEGYGERCADR